MIYASVLSVSSVFPVMYIVRCKQNFRCFEQRARSVAQQVYLSQLD